MLARVQAGAPTYNNSAAIAGSGLRSAAKLVYYYLFATAYGAAGGCAQVNQVSDLCPDIRERCCLVLTEAGLVLKAH